MRNVVIVGARLAGATAARSVRIEGFDGTVTMVGAEAHPPYERPPLSKEYLRGESQRDKAYVEAADFWRHQDVSLVHGIATAIDRSGGLVELADGSSLPFDRLPLATGASPRHLEIPGRELDRVMTLRTFEDADSLRAHAQLAEHVLIVGGGWIAAEVAASLRSSAER